MEILEFNRAKGRYANTSFAVEIDDENGELVIESNEGDNNGFENERHVMRLSKEEAERLATYLSAYYLDYKTFKLQ